MIVIPRISRQNLGTPFLHLMVQGINKEYIFKTNEYSEKYLKLINKYKEEYKITIIAYCIMSNHAHLLVYAENIEQLGEYMHKVNLIYSQFYNKKNNRCGVVFRNRYKAEPIHNVKYLVNCIRYIHMNPVKAKIVDKVEQFPYSSAKEYMNNGPITKNKIMKEIFGSEYNYESIFCSQPQYIFIDEEKPSYNEVKKYMDIAINDFLNENDTKMIRVLEDKETLIKIVKYLKQNCNFQYKDIAEKFMITNHAMRKLKK